MGNSTSSQSRHFFQVTDSLKARWNLGNDPYHDPSYTFPDENDAKPSKKTTWRKWTVKTTKKRKYTKLPKGSKFTKPKAGWNHFCKGLLRKKLCSELINDALKEMGILSKLFPSVKQPKIREKDLEEIKKKCHYDQACIREGKESLKKALLKKTLYERTGLLVHPQNKLKTASIICGVIVLFLVAVIAYFYFCTGNQKNESGNKGSRKAAKGSQKGKSSKTSSKKILKKSTMKNAKKSNKGKSAKSFKSGRKSGKKSIKSKTSKKSKNGSMNIKMPKTMK